MWKPVLVSIEWTQTNTNHFQVAEIGSFTATRTPTTHLCFDLFPHLVASESSLDLSGCLCFHFLLVAVERVVSSRLFLPTFHFSTTKARRLRLIRSGFAASKLTRRGVCKRRLRPKASRRHGLNTCCMSKQILFVTWTISPFYRKTHHYSLFKHSVYGRWIASA